MAKKPASTRRIVDPAGPWWAKAMFYAPGLLRDVGAPIATAIFLAYLLFWRVDALISAQRETLWQLVSINQSLCLMSADSPAERVACRTIQRPVDAR